MWPALCVVATFLIISLFSLLPALNGWLHLLILIGFGLAFAYAVGWLIPGLRRPSRHEAIRRLEQVNELEHRPLTRIEDRLATSNTDPEAAALWDFYRRRTKSEIGNLRIGAPHPNIVAKDPFALRAILGLLLIVALIVGWKDAPERIARSFVPTLSGFDFGDGVTVTLSITPPAYTNVAPLFLEKRPSVDETEGTAQAAATEIHIPTGSLVLAQLQGLSETPTLLLGDGKVAFEPLEPGTFQGKGEIKTGTRLGVAVEDTEIAGWPVVIVPDHVPSIEFAAQPGASERFALRLIYKAADDYGIQSVNAIIRRADKQKGPGDIAQIDLRLPLPGIDPKKAQQASFNDLTPHPWAGLPVEVQLSATDALGQTGRTAWVKTTLPERLFNHPVAAAVAEQRKHLMFYAGGSRERRAAPLQHRRPAAALQRRPDRRAGVRSRHRPPGHRRQFADDHARRARRKRSPASSICCGTWRCASRKASSPWRRSSCARCRKPCRRRWPTMLRDEEVQKLMDELQEAMDRYVDALKEKMDREPRGPRSRPQMNSNTVEMRREDLQKMLERARDLAKSGNRDAARELLAQMQQMLESLQTQQTAGNMSEDMEKAMQMLEDMDQLMDKQQELMDQTFRDAQQQQEGDQPMQGAAQRKLQQEALRDATGQMMRDYADMFGEVPPSLGRAEGNMRESSKALGEGRPQDALQPQSQALTDLQQAMQEMTNAMAQALQGQPGQDPRNQTGLGDRSARPRRQRHGGFPRQCGDSGSARHAAGAGDPRRAAPAGQRALAAEARARVHRTAAQAVLAQRRCGYFRPLPTNVICDRSNASGGLIASVRKRTISPGPTTS